MMRGMVIDMKDEQLSTLAQLRAFVDGTAVVDFAVTGEARYDFIARTVRRFGYARLKRPDKAVVLRFLERVSGYSRQQITRLVRRVGTRAPLLTRAAAPRARASRAPIPTPTCCCSRAQTPCTARSPDPATKKLMERAFGLFCDARYQRLATISVAHLYNLRKRTGYARNRRGWTQTRPVSVAIGERRAPAPNNQPGYLRVDKPCIRAIRTVPRASNTSTPWTAVTQFEAVATCERISEAYLIPVLEALLLSFPFVIRGFHSDNGSEYINHRVAKLLNKLLIEEQTKSRSRHSNDNAQAESRNAAIVRKHFGCSPIAQRFAPLVNAFCREHLNDYVNFHRPCLFAETITDAKGRQRKRYPCKLMMTPYEKLKSLPFAEHFLRPGTTFLQLDVRADSMSDNDAAQRLNDA